MVSDGNVLPTQGTDTLVFFYPYITHAMNTHLPKRPAIDRRGLTLGGVRGGLVYLLYIISS